MPFYKRISKKTLKLAIIILLAAAVLLSAAFTWFGTFELAQFNTRSLTDWRLGGSIDYIRSADDAKQYDADGFEWFSDERGEGIMQADTDTRYYLGKHPDSGLGGYGVIGFSSAEKSYSVLGIRVGDDELDAKTALLDARYKMADGGFNSCRAEKGRVFDRDSDMGEAVADYFGDIFTDVIFVAAERADKLPTVLKDVTHKITAHFACTVLYYSDFAIHLIASLF